MKFIVGIDEAGRGPLAGPVTVGTFGAEEGIKGWLLKNLFQNKLRDSKKLSERKREEIYKKLLILEKEGKVYFAVTHVSNKVIDRSGISKAVRIGISSCLKKYVQHSVLNIRLDGLLKAPWEYKNQRTIIKGDEKDVFIACASILAKVLRDRLMCRLAKKYPNYSLEIHKGYGTKLHRQSIKQNGISALHRVTFCGNI